MSTKTARRISSLLNLIVIFSMMLMGPLSTRPVQANTWAEPPDVPPGATITIYGNNLDDTPDQNWVAGEAVTVVVVGPTGYTDEFTTCSATVAEDGPGAAHHDSSRLGNFGRPLDLYRQLAEQRGDRDVHRCCFGRWRANL